ncbi:MAG TPA: hypothetical protein VGE53_00235 [Candidatus Paceibacterota bacterium]
MLVRIQTDGNRALSAHERARLILTGAWLPPRDVKSSEAFALSAILLCISALCASIAAIEICGVLAHENGVVAFVLLWMLAPLFFQALERESPVWKEILFYLVAGATIATKDLDIVPPFPVLALCVLYAFVYLRLLRKRAVWEPVALFLPFSIVLGLYLLDELPKGLTLWAMAVLGGLGFVGAIRIWYEGEMRRN